MKILVYSGLFWILVETVQNEVKEQKGGFFRALFGTLGTSLLGDLLIGKGAIATSQRRGIYRAGKGKGKGINRAGEGIVRAGYGNNNNNNNNKMNF